MINILITISVAISAFIATNLDDLFLLMVFFAHPDYKSSSVVIGQYVGIICIILICFPAYLLKSFIPHFWLALMGLIPLFLGLKQLYKLRGHELRPKSLQSEHNIPDKKSMKYNKKYNKLGMVSIAWVSIALITITNGADNIGVYVPLFTNLNQMELILTILIFLLMTGIWCLLGRFVIKNTNLGNQIKEYGHIILPFVLIILGIGIFISNILKI
jgi:cadmium resistance protein CadD (predicted permease)